MSNDQDTLVKLGDYATDALLQVIALQAEKITNLERQVKDLQVANNEYWKRITNQG